MMVYCIINIKNININWLIELSLNMNCGYLYEESNWLFESEK
jgi:hypothetical protein